MTEWKTIDTAPHDVPVRIKTENGTIHRPMRFTAPYWWDAPQGLIRFVDGHLYDGDEEITKAMFWQEAA